MLIFRNFVGKMKYAKILKFLFKYLTLFDIEIGPYVFNFESNQLDNQLNVQYLFGEF